MFRQAFSFAIVFSLGLGYVRLCLHVLEFRHQLFGKVTMNCFGGSRMRILSFLYPFSGWGINFIYFLQFLFPRVIMSFPGLVRKNYELLLDSL